MCCVYPLCIAFLALSTPSATDRLADDVCVVRDDAGAWGGPTTGMTHQRGPGYQAKKVLDLGGVPEEVWKAADGVRLSAFFCVRDYSIHDGKQPNGLDEAMEIVVNGRPRRVATGSGLPVYAEDKPMEQSMRWHDFELPKEWLVRGPNEIIFRLVAPQDKPPDDYLYLGIDNGVPGGRSWVKFSTAEPWRQDRLNAPGGKGEYMVRLYLLRGPREFTSVWRAVAGRTEDTAAMLLYAGRHGPDARLEWDPRRLDRLAAIRLTVEAAGPREFEFSWLDEAGQPVLPPVKAKGPRHETTLDPPQRFIPSGVRFEKALPLAAVTLRASRAYHPLPKPIDMAPPIAAAKGAPIPRPAACRIAGEKIDLENAALRCQFTTTGGRLRLASLYNEPAAAEVVRRTEDCALFLLELAGKRYVGSRDFACTSVEPLTGRQGFTAKLVSDALKLEASLSVWIDHQLRMGLAVTNRGDKPADFKLAFPHLAGLAISEDPAADYYFFPWGGGIIADAPAVIRRGYGDHEAIYQVMDLFSPARGAGLSLVSTDEDGRHKVLALRKHVPGRPETDGDAARTPTAEDYLWANSLPAVPGVGMAIEYLRRTRGPGETFTPKEIALDAHAGDWHTAMKSYADWCHRVWRFRPPSRLDGVVNMVAVGWGQDVLLRDGKYRTDFLRPRVDCVELMSWWEWSPLGPWGTPIDQIEKKLGLGKLRLWESYLPKDPVSGKRMFNNNPGDYDGYNQRWGGLPKFREAIEQYRKTGTLVTLYTDPLRVDGNSKCGQQYGKLWGVVQPDGKHRDDYDAWRMCHDVAEYRQWTAQAMGRVMRETGADGLRLDEYGHCGSACFSTLHRHTFAERGTTEWQRAIAETTKLVHQAMDDARPGSVLTTEHPGYDYLMQFIEGCITYDLSVQATPLRPLECNLQRFYFPECKAYELVYRPSFDPKFHKRFWNAVACFGAVYPENMDRVLREHAEVFRSRDCQPLVPTLARGVYANRFTGGEKTIYVLYNASGHSFYGPVLRLGRGTGQRVIDLLQQKEIACRHEGDSTVPTMFLGRDEVACLLTKSGGAPLP